MNPQLSTQLTSPKSRHLRKPRKPQNPVLFRTFLLPGVSDLEEATDTEELCTSVTASR